VTILGTDVHGKIRHALARERTAEATLSDRVYECEKRIARLVEEREEAFTRLAKRALPELSAETVRNTLHEVQSDVEKIYLERQERRRALEKEMVEAVDRRTALDARLQDLDGRRAAKVQEIENLKARVVEELRLQPGYPALREALTAATEEFHRIEHILRDFETRTSQKRQAYEANPVFADLLQRGYGTPGYRAGALTRKLDAWAAQKVDFLRQKAAYDLLRSGPGLLAEESSRRRRVRSETEEKVKDIEREVAGRHGLLAALDEARQLDHERVTVLELITRVHEDWTRKSGERADLDNTKGSHHLRALERLKTFLKGEEIASLVKRVAIEDAPTVTRISTIDAEIRILKNDAKAIQREQAEHAKRLKELQEVDAHIVARSYDSSRARFMNGLDIDAYVTGLLAGRLTAFNLCSHLDRYRYVEPTPTVTSSAPLFSSSSSSFDSSPSSTFSPGPSFDSGSSSSSSFSSGGGDSGGGGGFSTGGGF
jgi:uncharacterized membrane protein YgcG